MRRSVSTTWPGRWTIHHHLLLPEILNSIERWRFLFECPQLENCVSVLAIDEAHLLHSWGQEFRPSYSRIIELRSFFPGVPLLLLSATVSKETRDVLFTKLQLSPDVHIEWEVPNRPNIHITISCESGMTFTAMEWYLGQIAEKGQAAEKTVIYVNGITQMSKLAIDIMCHLGQAAYIDDERQNKIFKLYHSGMSKVDLAAILTEFSAPDSPTRFLVSTIAFGIGINIPDIRNVIHWGAPKTVEDYWQEVGRADRDGAHARAVMYATKVSLLGVSPSIRSLVKLDTCYRAYVLDMLSIEKQFTAPSTVCDARCEHCQCELCMCCSNCMRKCPCV